MGEVDEIIKKISPHYAVHGPNLEHNLVYDSASESLEPLYFWILDFIGKIGWNAEKIVDNFASSPGSGHFSELGLKKAQMQEQASKIMTTINSILRSVLNLIYDLKEFQIRLSHYDAARSPDKNVKEAGILALKQIWMDKVDVLRGQGSINALSSGNLQFVTLRDAFFYTNSAAEIEKLDLNDRVKRILKPRVQEFFEWQKRSETELRKRFEIEKAYLKSQVDSLKLQARWAQPYLRAAERLAQNEKLENEAALVTAFNTMFLQLTLLGKKEISIEGSATPTRMNTRMNPSVLPREFKHMAKKLRKYYSVTIIDFTFIGIPSKVGQHYVFGGKADIKFKAYGLNEDELLMLKQKLSDSYIEDSLRLVQGMTEDSINQLKIDLDEFLGDGKKEEKEKTGNPFSALFDLSGFTKKQENPKIKLALKLEQLKEKGVKKDSYAEAFLRNIAIAGSMDTTFLIYDILKKSYGMASFAYGGEKGSIRNIAKAPTTKAEKLFGLKG
ncbi:MAG: hypothetical protein AABX16_01220 [Nanoarchaeota archaeon]